MSSTKVQRRRPLALLYILASAAGPVEPDVSVDAQRAALAAEANRRSWDFELIADVDLNAKGITRPGLHGALARLDAGQADHLMAVRLDRISRSIADFASTFRKVKKAWGLVLLSPDLDTTSTVGKFTVDVLASASEYERMLVSVRTKNALAQRKAEGVKLGRPRTVPDMVVSRITRERRAGRSLRAIAEDLNNEGVPTAQGGLYWHASTVKAVAESTNRPGKERVNT